MTVKLLGLRWVNVLVGAHLWNERVSLDRRILIQLLVVELLIVWSNQRLSRTE